MVGGVYRLGESDFALAAYAELFVNLHLAGVQLRLMRHALVRGSFDPLWRRLHLDVHVCGSEHRLADETFLTPQ